MMEHHGGEHKDISVEIANTYTNDAMLRQVSEAEHIRIQKPDMNKRDEWQILRNQYHKARWSQQNRD